MPRPRPIRPSTYKVPVPITSHERGRVAELERDTSTLVHGGRLTPEEAMTRLLAFLAGLVPSQFYGEVRIRFRNGEVKLVTVEQDYLPETLPAGPPAATG
jgi:hypothetical protein